MSYKTIPIGVALSYIDWAERNGIVWDAECLDDIIELGLSRWPTPQDLNWEESN